MKEQQKGSRNAFFTL